MKRPAENAKARGIRHQERVMAVIGRLPRRLPVGTRYVLEGVPSEEGRLRVISRLLVLPSGEEFDLTNQTLEPAPRRRSHGARVARRRAQH
jgi:hypothetical protein